MRNDERDFLGDAMLKIFAVEAKVPNPTKWKWHANKELSKIFDNLFPDKLRAAQKIMGRGFTGGISIHTKGTIIESILGSAYLVGGVEKARFIWNRMLVESKLA